MIKRICVICGKEFSLYPSQIKQGGGKYCSHKCHSETRKLELNRACIVCGKTFHAKPYTIKRGSGKYCSKACQYNGQTTALKLVCKACGKEFVRSRSQIRKRKGHYCSPECRNKALVGGAAYWYGKGGSQHATWKGGKSFEPYCEKFNEELKEHIRSSFNRTCYICDKPETENGRKLICHHTDYNKMQGCGKRPWSLVSVCNSCSGKTNYNRWHWFLLLYNHWAMNQDINFF